MSERTKEETPKCQEMCGAPIDRSFSIDGKRYCTRHGNEIMLHLLRAESAPQPEPSREQVKEFGDVTCQATRTVKCNSLAGHTDQHHASSVEWRDRPAREQTEGTFGEGWNAAEVANALHEIDHPVPSPTVEAICDDALDAERRLSNAMAPVFAETCAQCRTEKQTGEPIAMEKHDCHARATAREKAHAALDAYLDCEIEDEVEPLWDRLCAAVDRAAEEGK